MKICSRHELFYALPLWTIFITFLLHFDQYLKALPCIKELAFIDSFFQTHYASAITSLDRPGGTTIRLKAEGSK